MESIYANYLSLTHDSWESIGPYSVDHSLDEQPLYIGMNHSIFAIVSFAITVHLVVLVVVLICCNYFIKKLPFYIGI